MQKTVIQIMMILVKKDGVIFTMKTLYSSPTQVYIQKHKIKVHYEEFIITHVQCMLTTFFKVRRHGDTLTDITRVLLTESGYTYLDGNLNSAGGSLPCIAMLHFALKWCRIAV